MKKASLVAAPLHSSDTNRDRILSSAFELFTQNGYAATSTLKIATRAQVSKRELYALFNSKQAMLAACIADQAGRARLTPGSPAVRDRSTLAHALTQLGTTVLHEICSPVVITMFRLAIAEAQHSPEVALTLDRVGRQAVRSMVGQVIKQAHSIGLLGNGEAGEMIGQFLSLLFSDTVLALLLCVRQTPSKAEVQRRSEAAVAGFLALHPKA